MRSTLVTTAAMALMILVGCDRGATLVVDLRTDFAPGVEFDVVRVSLDGSSEAPVRRFVRSDEDFLDPQRVAEFVLSPGPVVARVALLTGGGRIVAERPVSVMVGSATAITVVIARSCAGISCGGDGWACHGGRCVDDSCVSEQPSACGTTECDVSADCPAGSPCAVRLCAEGVCLLAAGECPSGMLCSRTDGCVLIGVDAGPEDAGPEDAGPEDAGPGDAGPGDAGPPGSRCGDGDCHSGENCESCPEDCGACPFCGDGRCNGSETTCRDCASDCRHGHRGRASTGETCSADEIGLYRCVTMNDGVCSGLLVSQLCATPTGPREWIIASCMPSNCNNCFCEVSFGCNP